MKEGTVYLVFSVPYPWPLSCNVKMFSLKNNNSIIEIEALTNGAIKINIYVDNIIIIEFKSQPLQFDNAGQTILTLLWNNNKMEVFINNVPIQNSECADTFL